MRLRVEPLPCSGRLCCSGSSSFSVECPFSAKPSRTRRGRSADRKGSTTPAPKSTAWPNQAQRRRLPTPRYLYNSSHRCLGGNTLWSVRSFPSSRCSHWQVRLSPRRRPIPSSVTCLQWRRLIQRLEARPFARPLSATSRLPGGAGTNGGNESNRPLAKPDRSAQAGPIETFATVRCGRPSSRLVWWPDVRNVHRQRSSSIRRTTARK